MFIPPKSNYDRFAERWSDYIKQYKNFNTNDSPCLIEQFFKNNPGAQSALISCNCPRCIITC